MQFKLCGMNLQMPPLIDNLRFNRRDFLRMAALAGLTPWQAVLAQQHLPDEILGLVPEDRRPTLLARPGGKPGEWCFDLHLTGPCETVFFDI